VRLFGFIVFEILVVGLLQGLDELRDVAAQLGIAERGVAAPRHRIIEGVFVGVVAEGDDPGPARLAREVLDDCLPLCGNTGEIDEDESSPALSVQVAEAVGRLGLGDFVPLWRRSVVDPGEEKEVLRD